jgi:2-polyprenyl-3-methyl-5-hydroxy-6-metoxy-1,4-benzoquinol methylase
VTIDTDCNAIRDAYDAWHSQLDVDAKADSPWHQMIKARIDPDRDIRGRRVLEIGCGRGGLAFWLARHPAEAQEIVAADFSPAAIAKAEQFAASQGITQVTWTVADIQKLDVFQSQFDTVISCETIEHVADPPLAVRNLARALQTGGRLYLTTPNYLSTIGLYRVYCWVRGKTFDEGGQPICRLTMVPKTWAWVRAAGLRVVETDSIGQYLPVPGRPAIRLKWLEHPHLLMRWFGLHSLVIGQKPA